MATARNYGKAARPTATTSLDVAGCALSLLLIWIAASGLGPAAGLRLAAMIG